MYDDQTTFEQIKDYYGKVLSGNKDLQTSACCCSESFPPAQRAALELIDDEILARFYGCGRDAYIAAKLVGPQGKVIGVDMTKEQLAVA